MQIHLRVSIPLSSFQPSRLKPQPHGLSSLLLDSSRLQNLILRHDYSMALLSPQIQKSLLTRLYSNYAYTVGTKKSIIVKGNGGRRTGRCCSAIAIDSPASVSGVSGVRWGSSLLQGPREEMEDDAVIVQSDDLGGFSYAAVFDGHAGFSSVRFLRCVKLAKLLFCIFFCLQICMRRFMFVLNSFQPFFVDVFM